MTNSNRNKDSIEDHNGSGLLFREYSTVFDSWNLRFVRSILGGIIARQDRGGLRIFQFDFHENEDALIVGVEHYGNESVPHVRVATRLTLSRLRSMAESDEPDSAAAIYLDDIVDPSIPPGSEPVDGVHLVVRPPGA